MNVLALVEGPNHVCCRYRIAAFAETMNRRGLTLDVLAMEHGVRRRLAHLRAGRWADVALLQRKLLPLWQLRILRKHARRLIYDVDDAVFQRDSYSEKGPDSWLRLARFWATLQAADAVIVGNDYLRRRVESYIDADRVRVVPTCVDPRSYTPAAHRRVGSDARLVWIGLGSTQPSLVQLQPHLQAAGLRLPGLQLHVICDRYPELDGVCVVPRTWSSRTEAHELAQGDIGVNYLPDDAWSRGKCGLKTLQYMAAGLPVVANPVGTNCEMVVDGETGFLASTPQQWSEAIQRLACDPALRRRMGAAGRRLVENRYSVEYWAPRFADIVDDVAHDRSLTPRASTAHSPHCSPSFRKTTA